MPVNRPNANRRKRRPTGTPTARAKLWHLSSNKAQLNLALNWHSFPKLDKMIIILHRQSNYVWKQKFLLEKNARSHFCIIETWLLFISEGYQRYLALCLTLCQFIISVWWKLTILEPELLTTLVLIRQDLILFKTHL